MLFPDQYIVRFYDRSLLLFTSKVSHYEINCKLTALALGDTSVTLEEVTPPVFSSEPLFPTEVSFQL